MIVKGEESPLKREFDAFDVENIDLTTNDYKRLAIQNTNQTPLLLKDWNWRFHHKQNIIASAEGSQGSGKSMFLSACSIMASKIFGNPFYSRVNEEVLKQHLSFDPEDLDNQLQNSSGCQTFLNDEDRKANIGIMSNMISLNIVDYEEQLRKDQTNLFFATPELQDHKHFFIFELKHIVFNEVGFPIASVAMLKTPRYTDRKEFVWRGYVSFPFPSKEYLAQYDPLKDAHIKRLKSKYGNTLDPVEYYATKLFEDLHADLITTTKEGFIKPVNAELMYLTIAKEIGTRKFTTGGYKMLQAKLKQMIQERYQGHNIHKEDSLRDGKEKILNQRKELHERNIREAKRKRELKFEMLEMQLKNEEKKAELKAKSLELKEKDIERKANKKLVK